MTERPNAATDRSGIGNPLDLSRIEIREAEISDAAVLKAFGDRLLSETDHFIREPQERAATPEAMAQVILAFREAPRSALYDAWIDGRPIGEAVLMAGQLARTRHVGTVGIGVLKPFHGTGVADLLMQTIERRARSEGLLRLDLTVLANNPRARRFYERHGFACEGAKAGSVRIGDRLLDEILMAKPLTAAGGRER